MGNPPHNTSMTLDQRIALTGLIITILGCFGISKFTDVFDMFNIGKATDHPINITSFANEVIQDGLPGFPSGNITLGKDNVEFTISRGANRIDSQCQSYMHRPNVFDIPVDSISNVSEVYFLINAGYTGGFQDAYIGDITLIFSDNTMQHTSLVLGSTIREWKVGAQNQQVRLVTTATSENIQLSVYKDQSSQGGVGAYCMTWSITELRTCVHNPGRVWVEADAAAKRDVLSAYPQYTAGHL